MMDLAKEGMTMVVVTHEMRFAKDVEFYSKFAMNYVCSWQKGPNHFNHSVSNRRF
jgi:ABC-type polar amino acid transport system ATPase subunit